MTLLDELDQLDQLIEPDRPVTKRTGRRPGRRGWPGRGGGRATYLQPPVRWRGTSNQVCGLNPWSVGASAPLVGVPAGRIMAARQAAGSSMCVDPLSWFVAGLISRPSAFVEGEPGLGKSTLVRRICMGLAGFGASPLILGDLKCEYVNLIRALGGQAIPLGPGRGYLNVLDASEAIEAAAQLEAAAAAAPTEDEARRLREIRAGVLADAVIRRVTMVTALVTIQRGSRPEDWETSVVDRTIRLLDEHHRGVPVLADLLAVIREAPDELHEVVVTGGDVDEYRRATRALERSLIGLMGHGQLGETFAQQTTERLRPDRAGVYDISGIDSANVQLKAAALMACWSHGFGMVNVAKALADAGLAPERHFLIVQDELWQALRAAPGIVDLVDGLTRLDRNEGVAQVMVTHTLADLNALSEIDRQKARGFVERAGMVLMAGLPRSEMPLLQATIGMSQAEQALVTSWGSPPAWDTQGRQVPPPGRGNFLVKVGGRPGIPFHVELTGPELALNDTNHRWKQWAERARRGGRAA